MKLFKFFTFQFGESITKFYVVKYFWILMKFSKVVVKYHTFFSGGHEKKNHFNQFFRRHKKTEKWPFLVVARPCSWLANFLSIHNIKFKQIAMTMWNFIEIYWLDVLLNWARKFICFAIFFLVPSWFLRSMGAVAQNCLILQKFHLNQNCRVSKSKIIM